MRIVVELRRDADTDAVLKDLQRRTSLQSNFGAILLALVDGQPRQLSLRRMLQTFLEYRELTLIRRTSHALRKTEDRLEVVEGLITALASLQKVIAMIQESRDAATARASLMVQLDLSERQADAVLAMPLRRLTGLEQESLRQEADELRAERQRLKLLLDNRDQLLDALVQELRQLKKRFATPRRTRLVEGGDHLLAERAASQRPNAELQRRQALEALPPDSRILIQNDGQVKVVSPQLLGRLHLNEAADLGDEPSPARLILPINPAPRLLALTSSGRIALVRWEFAGQQPGGLERFLPTALEGETVISLLRLPAVDDETSNNRMSLGLLTTDGRFKRLPLNDIQELSGRAATVLKLKEGVTLLSAMICSEGGTVALVSDIGRVLCLPVEEQCLPLMGKLAQGPMTMRMLPGEKLVGAVSQPASNDDNVSDQNNGEVLVGSNNGHLIRLSLGELRRCRRGDLGEIAVKLSAKGKDADRLVAICESADLIGVVSSKGRNARIVYDTLSTNSNQPSALNLRAEETLSQLVPLDS